MKSPTSASLRLPLSSSFYPGSFPKRPSADVLVWPSTSPSPRGVLLFIPGNPGLPDYYIRFLSRIHNLVPSLAIYAVGHLGHTRSSHDSVDWWNALRGRAPGLKAQVANQLAALDWIRNEYGIDMDVVVAGHSVGAFIACEVMKARPDAIKHLYALFPTISHIAATPNGTRMAPLFWPIVASLVFLLQSLLLLLPVCFLHSLVGLVTRQSEPASRVTASLICSPPTTSCALAMARDEMTSIKDLDKGFLASHARKLTFYWAKGEDDAWVPDASVREVIEVLERLPKAGGEERGRWFRCDEGMPHAFCLEHSLPMAGKCAHWIAADLAIKA